MRNSRLMECNNCGGVQFPCINRRPSGNTKTLTANSAKIIVQLYRTYQWDIIHAIYHHTLVFRRVLCYPSQVCFEDMISVKERHFTIWFYPNLQVQQIWSAW